MAQLPVFAIPPRHSRSIMVHSFDIFIDTGNRLAAADQPDALRSYRFYRRRLRSRLRQLGYSPTVQHHEIMKSRIGRTGVLNHAANLQSHPKLQWMPWGMRRLHVFKKTHKRRFYVCSLLC